MKRLAFVIVAILATLCVSAVETSDTLSVPASPLCIVDSINAAGGIHVVQSAQMTSLVSHISSTSGETAASPAATARSGYRVQVFEDNNPRTARHQASVRQQQMLNHFPQWRAYVNFNSPYWQVRVGDFRTRVEAQNALNEIKEIVPSATPFLRIVRERINHND